MASEQSGGPIDVFISYAHIDDEPLSEGQKGWITSLHNSLQVRLNQLMGGEIRIWRDERLTGNDDFSPVIYKQFEKTVALISVLSPRYLRSEWCLNELQAFLQAAEGTGGVTVDDSVRVFKVIKTFVPRKEHPKELQSVLGYEFYQLDPASGRPREFLLDLGPEASKNYWSKLEDLAYDIHGLLKKLQGERGALAAEEAGSGPVVYLAEATSDVNVERDKVRRELLKRGCSVLPRMSLPLEAGELCRGVSDGLAESCMSIHIVGERFGIVPEGEDRSIAQIQYELAAQVARPGFSRIVWSVFAHEPADERQRRFQGRIRESLSSHREDEYLQTNIGEFKNFLWQRLSKPEAPKPAGAEKESGAPIVYLICDRKDLEAARPLYDTLFEAGVDVTLPAFEGEDADISKTHIESLTACDAALLYFGAASEIWIRTKLRDLQKAAGYGRTKSLPTAVFVAGPPSPAKDLFRSQNALVLRGANTLSPDELRAFLDRIKSA